MGRYGEEKLQPWLGVWESTDRSENFRDFIKSLGVSAEKHGKLSRTFLTYRREGDDYYAETFVPGITFTQSLPFHFGQEGSGKRFGTSMKYTFREKGPEMHCEVELPELNQKFNEWCKVEDGELVKVFEGDCVTAKRWYTRTSGLPSS
ncbi:SAHS13 [Ramazzottius varieornatus]|uniref:SAHS13 n=1 Tax=Ramazzottius varieornatus TaxID=947166 RepID=A0A1D1UUV8_RAMVA|nr:SAHS13 [Ramazzottius varieornatus]